MSAFISFGIHVTDGENPKCPDFAASFFFLSKGDINCAVFMGNYTCLIPNYFVLLLWLPFKTRSSLLKDTSQADSPFCIGQPIPNHVTLSQHMCMKKHKFCIKQ